MIIELFPIPVGQYNLSRSITDQELGHILQLEMTKNEGNLTSKRHNIFMDPELADIREFCLRSLSDYVSTVIIPQDDCEIQFTQSWSNTTDHNQWHHRHQHPNSVVSGVFYVKTNSGDRIMFFRDQYQQIKIQPQAYNMYNSDSWWLPVQSGQLLLFPSNLTHMVPRVEESGLRVSISFNTFPKGRLGQDLNLTELWI